MAKDAGRRAGWRPDCRGVGGRAGHEHDPGDLGRGRRYRPAAADLRDRGARPGPICAPTCPQENRPLGIVLALDGAPDRADRAAGRDPARLRDADPARARASRWNTASPSPTRPARSTATTAGRSACCSSTSGATPTSSITATGSPRRSSRRWCRWTTPRPTPSGRPTAAPAVSARRAANDRVSRRARRDLGRRPVVSACRVPCAGASPRSCSPPSCSPTGCCPPGTRCPPPSAAVSPAGARSRARCVLVALYARALAWLRARRARRRRPRRRGRSADTELDRYARHIVLREIGGPGQKALKTGAGAGGGGRRPRLRRRCSISPPPGSAPSG